MGAYLGEANPGNEHEAACLRRAGPVQKETWKWPQAPSPSPLTPDRELPQCLSSLLLSGEVDPEALLGAQAAERGVWGSWRPSIIRTQAPGAQEGRGLGHLG